MRRLIVAALAGAALIPAAPAFGQSLGLGARSQEWDAMAPAGDLPLLLTDANRPIVAARRGAPASVDSRARLALFAAIVIACLPLLGAGPVAVGGGLAVLFLGTTALAGGGGHALAAPRPWRAAVGPLLLPLALAALAGRAASRGGRLRLPAAYALLGLAILLASRADAPDPTGSR